CVLALGSNVTLPREKSLFLSLTNNGVKKTSPLNLSFDCFSPFGNKSVLFSAVVASIFLLSLQADMVIIPTSKKVDFKNLFTLMIFEFYTSYLFSYPPTCFC